MGGFLGIGGSASKTNRKEQLTSMSELHNVFNFALPTAESGVSQGQGDLSTAGDYWKKLLTGNRATMEAATAPEANAIRAGSDAQKRQQAAFGTARGGGTAGANETRATDTQAKVDNLITGVRPEAAKETAKIGGAELQAALNALGLGETSAIDLGKLATDAKSQSDANNAAAGQAAGQLASAFIGLL